MKLELAPEFVVRDDHAQRPPTDDERDVERRPDAHPASGLLVDLGIVQNGIDPLATPSLENTARLRASELELHSHESVRVRPLSVGCSDTELFGSGFR